jgi:hypothetical protein
MSNTFPAVEVLEARAAEQRRHLHNSVAELRSTLREKLDVKKTTREHLAPAAGAAAVLGLALGYTLTAIFTD